MKDEFKKEITQFEDNDQRNVTKGDFTCLFGHAYLCAFNKDTVTAGFYVTGIHSFNQDVIMEQQMKPSIPSTMKEAFPLSQPSPVCAVMAAFHHNPPMLFDISPPTYMHTQSYADSDVNLMSPTLKHVIDESIDPALFMPSKWMRSLYSTMSFTSSGSFLVSKTPHTSAIPIIPPIFEGPLLIALLDWHLTLPCGPIPLTQAELERGMMSFAKTSIKLRLTTKHNV
ncbi:hypothetical protein BJV74DRAFT_770170 [Russula compacta]|nr:hypothetical protein BJV74DRAFT_770170 [Russula compacta]